MKITFSTGITCPKCKKEFEFDTGFWGAFLANVMLNKIHKDGAEITCHNCNNVFRVNGTKQQEK